MRDRTAAQSSLEGMGRFEKEERKQATKRKQSVKGSPHWETSVENICRHFSITARKENPCHRDTQKGLTTCGIWLKGINNAQCTSL